ncbi:MAG TPA: hypothetical protein VKA54_11015 [Gemmatimonadaceae bacterium]|nr:hypothetical protein [Gemmatimonadaceae bacterium]
MTEAHVYTAASMKRAETTSSIGAGVLGAGIGLMLADLLAMYALPIIAIGLVMHAWGMYDKRRLEALSDVPRVWWATAFYWVCWIALAALIIYIVARRN